jgi:hypothetical protein
LGKDDESALPLSASRSEDDSVLANDGGYFELAKSF